MFCKKQSKGVLHWPEDRETIQTFTDLEMNFRNQRQFGLANEAAYLRQVRARQDIGSPLIRLGELVVFDWGFGYFWKPLWAVRTALIMILFFTIFYLPAGIVDQPKNIAPPKPRERKLTFRLSELPLEREGDFEDQEEVKIPPSPFNRFWIVTRLARAFRRFWDAFSFSFSVFTKTSYGIRVARQRWLVTKLGALEWTSLVVIVEWVLGLLVLAGLAYSLSNTVPLLNVLLRPFF